MQEAVCASEIKILPHPKNYNSTIFPLRLVDKYLFKKSTHITDFFTSLDIM